MKLKTISALAAIGVINCFSATQFATPPRGSFRVAYDDTKWIPEEIPDREQDTFRRALTHISGNMYFQVNTENFDFSDLEPAQTIIGRVKRSDPYAKLLKSEPREINGIKGEYFEMQTQKQGRLPFRLVFFVHSGTNGSIQFMIYMPESVADKYELDINELVAGIEFKKE